MHDDRYMGIVYEVVDLPGGAYESYTPEQQELIRARRDAWKYRLQTVQSKLSSGLTLDDNDKALIAYIARSGGTNAVYGADERLRVQRGQRERFKRGLEISGRYDARFREIFRRAGLPEDPRLPAACGILVPQPGAFFRRRGRRLAVHPWGRRALHDGECGHG